MRIRTVKPEFWQHEMHETISETAALLAVALLNYADDKGRFKVQLGRIRALLFTHRPKFGVPFEEAFEELKKCRWVFTYKALIDGQQVEIGQVTNFERHQTINRPQESRFPAPSKKDAGGLTERSVSTHDKDAGGLTEYSRGKEGKEGKGKERKEGDARAGDSDSFVEPTLEEVLRLGEMRGISPECCEKFFWENKKTGWKHRGEQIVSWEAGLQSFWVGWRGNVEERRQQRRPEAGDHPERKASDRPEWWTMALSELRDLALSLAKSSDPKNKNAAGRVAEIIAIREKEGGR